MSKKEITTVEDYLEYLKERSELFDRMPDPQTIEEGEEMVEILEKELEWLRKARKDCQDFIDKVSK